MTNAPEGQNQAGRSTLSLPKLCPVDPIRAVMLRLTADWIEGPAAHCVPIWVAELLREYADLLDGEARP